MLDERIADGPKETEESEKGTIMDSNPPLLLFDLFRFFRLTQQLCLR